FYFIIMAKPQERSFELLSPHRKVKIHVEVADQIKYHVWYQGKQILKPSSLSLTLEDKRVLGVNPRLAEVSRQRADNIIRPVVREKNEEITDRYEELHLRFEE